MNIADAHLERYSNLHIMDAHRNGVWLKGKFAILVHCSTKGEGDETELTIWTDRIGAWVMRAKMRA